MSSGGEKSDAETFCDIIEAEECSLVSLRASVLRIAEKGQLQMPVRDGRSLLQLACHRDRPHIVRLLLDVRSELKEQHYPETLEIPLSLAVTNGSDYIVKMLLAEKADPNYHSQADDQEYSALYEATKRHALNTRLHLLLMQHGASGHGVTTLNLAGLGLTHLPGDKPYWHSFSSLMRLDLRNNHLPMIPSTILNLPSLTVLNVSHNNLEALPAALSSLSALVQLELNHNQIQTLPHYMASLSCLLCLNLSNNNWRTITPSLATLTSLTQLNMSNNYLQSFPSSLSSLYCLSDLNLRGNQFQAFPQVLLTLPSLTKINLSNNSIDALPPEIAALSSLEILLISDNKLQSLPSTLTTLPALLQVSFSGNPLSEIPQSFCSAGWSAELKMYLRTILDRSEDFLQRKILLVGQEGVGKTTLLRCLADARGRTDTRPDVPTNGIGVQNFALSVPSTVKSGWFSAPRESNAKSYQFTAWDLGGQEVFYPSHQFFLSGQAIYLVVFNLADPNYERLDYWMNQLRSSASTNSPSPILLVGTHADSPICHDPAFITRVKTELKSKFPSQRFPALKHSLIVDCQSGGGIPGLKDKLLALASAMKMIVAPTWIALQQRLQQKLEQHINYLSWTDYQDLAVRSQVELEELSLATKFLQDVGSVIHFDDRRSRLQELVILHPQWLASLMASFVSYSHRWHQAGRIARSQIAQVLRGFNPQLHESLLALLERFGILVRLPRKGDYVEILIPSLLPPKKPEGFYRSSISSMPTGERKGWSSPCPPTMIEHSRIFDFPFLPLGFFDRVLVGTFFLPFATDHLTAWRHGVLLCRKECPTERCLITFHLTKAEGSSSNLYTLRIRTRMEMSSFSQGSPNLLLNELVKLVEHIVSCYFPRLQDSVRRYIPCLHCVRSKTIVEPYRFSFEDCVAALTRNEPIVFCRGFRMAERTVLISHLAPDITFRGYSVLSLSDLGDRDSWESIGKGGFGQVYKATYRDKPVAVKELLNHDADTSSTEKFSEFQKEVQIMSVMRHNNIVNLIGITIQPLLMVSEFVQGGDLHQLLREPQGEFITLTTEQKFRISFDIAAGMEYLQALTPPIVHRDLRSPNIFIESLDVDAPVCAKVADFGLSAFVAHEVAGSLMTWQWLAPEVLDFDARSYDERSDIYSYGIVMWELLTSKMPFDEYARSPKYSRESQDFERNSIMMLDAHAVRTAIIQSHLRPSIPADCPAVLAKIMELCWKDDPDKRPSFTEIIRLLADFVPPPIFEAYEKEKGASTHSVLVARRSEEVEQRYENGRREEETLLESIKTMGERTSLPKPYEMPLKDAVACLLLHLDSLWVGLDSGKIQVFDISELDPPSNCGRLELSWLAHKDRIFEMVSVHTPDSSEVWSGSGDKRISAWNSDTGEHLWETELRSLISGLLMVPGLPDGTGDTVWAAAGEENSIYVFAVEDYANIRVITLPNNLPCFSITLHLGLILVGSLGLVFIYDREGTEIASWQAVPGERPVRFMASSSPLGWEEASQASGDLWTCGGCDVKQWFFRISEEISITEIKDVTAHDARLTTMKLIRKPSFTHSYNRSSLELWTSSYDYCNFLWKADGCQPFFEFQLAHEKEFMRDVLQFRSWAISGSSFREACTEEGRGSLYFYKL